MNTRIKHLCCKLIQRIPVYTAVGSFLVCVAISFTDAVSASHITQRLNALFTFAVVNAGFVTIYSLSKAMGMCRVQRLGILYTYLFLLCVWLRINTHGHYGIFGQYIHHFHALVSAIGLTYIIYVIRRRCTS